MADIFEKFIKISLQEYESNSLYLFSLHGYFWRYTFSAVQVTFGNEIYIVLESNYKL